MNAPNADAAASPIKQFCNLCGGEDFGPGPHGRLGNHGLGPHCLHCGSLERHRAAGRLLQSMPVDYLDWRRALLVGAERGADQRWFRHCDVAPSSAPGMLAPDLDNYDDGSYDFIALVQVLEYLDNDQAGFEQLLRLLSPLGLLQVCFIEPRTRPWTSIQTGPAGSVRRWYGRDLFRHFRCLARQLHMTMKEVADPGTGQVLPVHFFYKQPQHHQALAAAPATP